MPSCETVRIRWWLVVWGGTACPSGQAVARGGERVERADGGVGLDAFFALAPASLGVEGGEAGFAVVGDGCDGHLGAGGAELGELA